MTPLRHKTFNRFGEELKQADSRNGAHPRCPLGKHRALGKDLGKGPGREGTKGIAKPQAVRWEPGSPPPRSLPYLLP